MSARSTRGITKNFNFAHGHSPYSIPIQQQLDNIDIPSRHFIKIISSEKYSMVIAHGYGPKVGNLLLQNEAARNLTPLIS